MQNLSIVFATVLFLGCTGTQKSSVYEPTEDQMSSGHTSQNSLDWKGTYRGILPCDNCEGIQVTVTLSKDLTYKQTSRQMGGSDERQENAGKFSWNKNGNSITLEPNDASGSIQYSVGENSLAQLDDKGNKVGGNDAAQHILSKANYDILEKYWKLVELSGNPIKTDSTFRKEAHIIFKEADNRINGNGGCNTIGGVYTIRGMNSLSTSNLFSTKMFCQNMDLETQFMTVLQAAESFNLNGDSLTINSVQRPAAAKFVAIYMK
jgi:heat shock protein HslJ